MRFYNKVGNQLNLNRKILKEFNKGGKVTLRSEMLIEKGLILIISHIIGRTKREMFIYLFMNMDF